MDELISKEVVIETLKAVRDLVWEVDIPSPTVPEYIEHHEQMQSIMRNIDILTDKIIKMPSAQPEPPKTFHVIDTHTGEEADPYEIALNEDWAKHLMYCDMEGFAIEEDGTLLLLDECGQHEYCPSERFEVTWDYE